MLTHLDGPTSGPKAYSGKLGKALANCHNEAIVTFKIIETDYEFPIIINDLSSDQHLLDICNAVVSGIVSPSLEKRSPGKLNHSR